MRKIGQHRVSNQPPTQSVGKTGASSVETQKSVKDKEPQQQEQKNQPLNENVKGQRRTDKQYSGLMKRVLVDGKLDKQQPGQPKPLQSKSQSTKEITGAPKQQPGTTPLESKSQPMTSGAPNQPGWTKGNKPGTEQQSSQMGNARAPWAPGAKPGTEPQPSKLGQARAPWTPGVKPTDPQTGQLGKHKVAEDPKPIQVNSLSSPGNSQIALNGVTYEKGQQLGGITFKKEIRDGKEVEVQSGTGANGEVWAMKPPEGSKAPSIVAKSQIQVPLENEYDTFAIDYNKKINGDLLREGKVHQAVGNHKNMVQYLGTTGLSGKPALVMESVAGGSMKKTALELDDLHRQGRITDRQLNGTKQYVAKEMLDGMSHMQSKGVVHNDIKLDNLLLDPRTLRPKFSDFGTAKAPNVLVAPDPSKPRVRVPGDSVGSPEYTAPEVNANKTETRTHRSDMFAMGATMHTLFKGNEGLEGLDTWNKQNRQGSLVQGNNPYSNFINSMTARNPQDRLTPEQALNHPWMQQNSISDREAQGVLQLMLQQRK